MGKRDPSGNTASESRHGYVNVIYFSVPACLHILVTTEDMYTKHSCNVEPSCSLKILQSRSTTLNPTIHTYTKHTHIKRSFVHLSPTQSLKASWKVTATVLEKLLYIVPLYTWNYHYCIWICKGTKDNICCSKTVNYFQNKSHALGHNNHILLWTLHFCCKFIFHCVLCGGHNHCCVKTVLLCLLSYKFWLNQNIIK